MPATEGCDEGACPRPPAEKSRIDIGEGSADSASFRALPEDGRIALHAGPQFGYHVFAQVRLVGLDPDRVTITRRLRDVSGGDALREQRETLGFVCPPDEDSWLLAQGQILFVCPSLVEGEAMHDRDLRLEVEARDGDGRVIEASRTIRPTCPDDDEVCSGDTSFGCAAP